MSRRRLGLFLICMGATSIVGGALLSRGASVTDRADIRSEMTSPETLEAVAGTQIGACYLPGPTNCNPGTTSAACDSSGGVYGGHGSTCCVSEGPVPFFPILVGPQPAAPPVSGTCPPPGGQQTGPVPTPDLETYMNFDLAPFLRSRLYAMPAYDWAHDRDWRLTGRYQGCPGRESGADPGTSYGVHPAVRIYYSPEVVEWMCNGRPGSLPPGAMIIKEMRDITGIGIDPQRACSVSHMPCSSDDDCNGEQCIQPMWLHSQVCSGSDAGVPCTTSPECQPDPGGVCTEPEPTSWSVMVKGVGGTPPPPGFATTSHDDWFWVDLGKEFGNPPIINRSALTTTTEFDFFDPEERLINHCPTRYPVGQAGAVGLRCSASGDSCTEDLDCLPFGGVCRAGSVCSDTKDPCTKDTDCTSGQCQTRSCSDSCAPCWSSADCPTGACEGACSVTGELCAIDAACPGDDNRCVSQKAGSIVYPNYEFGSYCVNCHASAVSESTYSDLRNITGEQITYEYCAAGEPCCPTAEPCSNPGGPPAGGIHHSTVDLAATRYAAPLRDPDPDFLQLFDQFGGPVPFQDAWDGRLPAETYDHALTTPTPGDNTQQFLTSDQCSGCHNATRSGNLGVNMIKTVPVECTSDAECEDACSPHAGFCNMQQSPHVCEFSDFNGQLCGDQVNLSPYGEWQASPMGLAGRDPIFFAQVETETNLSPSFKDCIETYCLHCHSSMAQRQKAADETSPPAPPGFCDHILDPEYGPEGFLALFTRDDLDSWPNSPAVATEAEYAGLGRDGVSCAVCHHISGEGLFSANNSPNGAVYVGVERQKMTANFGTDPADTINGPYPDPVRAPMKNALGITPRGAPQIEKAGLCGTCHVLRVPVLKYLVEGVDGPAEIPLACLDGPDRIGSGPAAIAVCDGMPMGTACTVGNEVGLCKKYFTFEQTTYLEFLNSYFNEIDTTCQDCHMPSTFHDKDDEELAFKIANIEDEESFPPVHQRLAGSEINLPERGGCSGPDCAGGGQHYRRHTLYGLNIFLNEIVQQFPLIVGRRQIDYLNPAAVPALITARESVLHQARKRTAEISVDSVILDRDLPTDRLTVEVTVTNKTGHKLPSGVGFRRAFIELLVCETPECTCASGWLWRSGCTDSLGVIVDGSTGQRLASEFSCPVNGAPNATCPPGVTQGNGGCPEIQGPDDQCYQPHFGATTMHDAIGKEDEVQIFQLLETDCDSRFTSSVTHLCDDVKDNRLLPKGWQANGPWAASTKPGPLAGEDPDYQSGGPPGVTGAETVTYRIDLIDPSFADRIHSVQATLYSQSIPPSFLNDRFHDAKKGTMPKEKDSKQLYHMASRLNVAGLRDDADEPFLEDWKLKLVSDSALVQSAGVVPPTMRLDRPDASQLRISWSPSSCSGVDYGIYRGTLSSLHDPFPNYDHVAVVCGDVLPLLEEDLPLPVDDSYYLVVPITDFLEGSYGVDSFQAQRPVGTGTAVCRTTQDLTVCP